MPLADKLIIQDPKRLEKLYSLNLLDAANEPAFDRLTRLARKVLNAPISVVTLVDANRQFILSQVGLDEPTATTRENDLHHSYCQHVVALTQPLIIEDARLHPLLFDNLAIQDDLIAYAGMPLTTSDGFTLGSFCVMDKKVRTWTPDEIEILTELSFSVIAEIELRTELKQRKEAEAALQKSQQFSQHVIATIPGSLYVFDLQRKKIIFANQSAAFSENDTMDLEQYAAVIHPDDLPLYNNIVLQAQELKDNALFETEFRRRNSQDQWVWVHIQCIVFTRSDDGKPRELIALIQDVTERKRTEDDLRENQHLLQRILDAVPDSLYIHDMATHQNIFVTQKIAEQLGYPIERIREHSIIEFIEPQDMPRLSAYYERLSQSPDGTVLDIEYRVQHANGNWLWITSRNSVFKRNHDGTMCQTIGIARDITENKAMEEAVRTSTARLRAVLTNVPLVLFSTDEHGTFTLSMGKGLDSLGKNDNEAVGTNVFDAYRDNEPVLDFVRRALTGETVTGMINIGSMSYEIWYAPLFDEEAHHITGMIGIAIEISERVRTEQALQETLENLMTLREVEAELSHSLNLESVLLVAMDTVLRLTNATDGFIGLISNDEVEVVQPIGRYQLGQRFNRNQGVGGRVLLSQAAVLLVDVSRDPDYIQYLEDTKSLMSVPLTYRERLIGIINLESPDPATFTQQSFEFMKLIVGQITLAIDNAQLYEVSQQQLLDMTHLYARVSELEQLKTDIIRIAAHDLRNPLTQVLGYSELLLEEQTRLEPEAREFTEAILKAGAKMERIIKDILSLERIEASTGEQQETIDLKSLVETLFFENEVRAQQKQQIFTLEVPETPVQVHADGAQLREAIDNLIGNAIKYTFNNRSITVKLYTDANNNAIFEVVDGGIGIPEDQQTRLFQPFYRVKTEETARIEGTGLGLHLVKNIIERHQGKMLFKSVYGEGSTFGFEMKMV